MENTTPNTPTTTSHVHQAKSDARYLKLEIVQLAAELVAQNSTAVGAPVKIEEILATADQLADFVFAPEENLT